MTDFNLKASLLPPKFQHFDYLVADDQEWDKTTRKDVPATFGYQRPILLKSEEIYASEATIPLDASIEDKLSMLKMVDILYHHLYRAIGYIENSPNSVCEAQLLGIPVVTTNVGGVWLFQIVVT